MSRPKTAPLVRILPRVVRDPETGCWDYTGYLTPAGYGQVWDGEHRNAFAHRVVYEQTRGPIPLGMELDHLCRNRACCNPFHVEIVDRRENQHRGNSPTGMNVRVTVCPRGHAYDEANTYFRPDGTGRDCKKCRAARQRGNAAEYRNAEILRDVRVARGWTRNEIAEHVGLPAPTVSRIEAGQRTEVDAEVFALLDALLSEFDTRVAAVA